MFGYVHLRDHPLISPIFDIINKQDQNICFLAGCFAPLEKVDEQNEHV